jgi:argininosuccinate synthase
MAERVVLAYSGGLDTSVGIGWLQDATGKEVVALAVDVGQGGEDMEDIRQRAGGLRCRRGDRRRREGRIRDRLPHAGAQGQRAVSEALPARLGPQPAVDRAAPRARRARARRGQRRARLHGQGQRPGAFRGGGRSARPRAHEHRADPGPRAHPRQGDRLREEHGLPIKQSKKNPYSIDKNVWGRAVETGFLEDPWNAPIEDLYEYTADPSADGPADEVTVTFAHGVPTALNGVAVTPLQAVEQLNAIAGRHGVGRIDIVEDRLVGIKSREVYEAPGAIALITAHEELENLTLERDVNRYKRGVEAEWSGLVYDGLWYSGLKRSLDAFIDHTQEHVTGDIRLSLQGGRATVTGRQSAESLYDFSLATYDTGDTFDQSLAKGFIELWSLPSKISARRDNR